MITLFTTTKNFEGEFNIIQRNAISSWRAISNDIEIIIIGQSNGAEEVAGQFNAKYINEVKCTLQGTPTIKGLFDVAETNSLNDILCYVNADIILPKNFLEIIDILKIISQNFMAVGYRWDLDIRELIDFQNELISRKFWDNAIENAQKHACTGIDYFFYRKGSINILSNIAIGRFGWDNWFLWQARRMRIPLIDLSKEFFIIHQNHSYNNDLLEDKDDILKSQDGIENSKIIGDRTLNLLDCTYILENGKIHRKNDRDFIQRYLHRLPKIFPEFSIPLTIYRRLYNWYKNY